MANGETIVEHQLDAEGADPLTLTGVTDRNLQEITRLFSIRVVMRGDHLILSGSLDSVERAAPVVQHMIELSRLRAPFDVADIGRFADGGDAATVNRHRAGTIQTRARTNDPARANNTFVHLQA